MDTQIPDLVWKGRLDGISLAEKEKILELRSPGQHLHDAGSWTSSPL